MPIFPNMDLNFRHKVRYKTDAVLTHTASVLAGLHRATLMNQHHIKMIVGNMAGSAAIGGMMNYQLQQSIL